MLSNSRLAHGFKDCLPLSVGAHFSDQVAF